MDRSQLQLLARVVESARATVPYYQDVYGGARANGDGFKDFDAFASLPPLTKDAVKASFPDRIVSAKSDPRLLYPVATSGTTDRVMLFHDESKRDWDRAADLFLRWRSSAGLPVGKRSIIIPPDACYERCGADSHGRLSTVRSRMSELVRARRDQRSELFCVEFMRSGRPVAPGELGELLITDLRNHVAPLIRYAIGDVGRYFDPPCPCGFQGLTFTVDGRMDETVVTPGGVAFTGEQIVDFFLRRPEIGYAKVVQQSDDLFRLEAVPSDPQAGLPSSDELADGFTRFLGYPVRLQVRAVRRLAPERSGKYRLVLSQSHGRFHGGAIHG